MNVMLDGCGDLLLVRTNSFGVLTLLGVHSFTLALNISCLFNLFLKDSC